MGEGRRGDGQRARLFDGGQVTGRVNGAMEASLSTEGREGTTGNMFFPDSYVFLSPVTARGASRTRNQINLRSPKTELGLVFVFDHASRKFDTCEEQVKAVKERLLGGFQALALAAVSGGDQLCLSMAVYSRSSRPFFPGELHPCRGYEYRPPDGHAVALSDADVWWWQLRMASLVLV